MPDSLNQLRKDILSCQRCELRETATQPVPGIGNIGAKYFICGEAPGRQEDEEGCPFVGMSGRRLDKLIGLAGIDINDCYLSNVCRCRPPDNRTPRKKEVTACKDYLMREIALVKPETIITLGSTPLGLFCPHGVTHVHGTVTEAEVDGVKYTLIPQFHPAAALHQPRLWATLLDDWQNLPEHVNADFTVVDQPNLNLQGMTLAALDTETDNHGGVGQWSIAYRDGSGRLCVAPFYGSKPVVQFGNCPVVFHNAKYDIRELRDNGMPVPEKFHDTMIQAYCLGLGKQAPKEDSKAKSGADMVGGLGLKYLARRHLGLQMMTWEQVREQPDKVPEYNAADSTATYLLAEKWLPVLPKHYFTIDMPLLPVLMAMEDRGVLIDPDYLSEYAKELDNRLGSFSEDAQHLAFHTQDMQSYIYGTLGIEPFKFTDSGKPSVDSDVLETIGDPLVKEVLAYKELYKDKGTYVDNYIKGRDEQNRIHAEFKQTSTSTGRLSCARPNLQNVDKEGNMRKLFVAPRGQKIVRVDYNQLEWRVLGAITQDPKIIAALNSGKKIHQLTAEEMGVEYSIAKRGNFGVIYGAQPWKLSQTLGCTINEAREFLDLYFKRFPGVKKYQDEMRETIKRDKKVTNWFGRTRRIDAMYVEQKRIQEEGIKEGTNMPIQGAGGEIVKIAMIDLHEKHRAPMVLQVHDELLFYIDEKDAPEYAHWLEEYIPTLIEINGMKFTVDASWGDNWKETSK